MLNETIRLIEPTLSLRADFYSLAEEFLAEGDQRYREAIADFEDFIQLCSDETVGRNLAPSRVPHSTFWLVRNEQRILGCSRLRHTLNVFLEEEGGHIGYDVRPSERRRGADQKQKSNLTRRPLSVYRHYADQCLSHTVANRFP